MTALDELARVSDGTPIGVSPSITKTRPPRPRAQPTRSFPKRSIFVLSGLAVTLGATLVWLSPARAFWAETEWQNLPAIDSPSAPGVEREAFPVPDAWAIANAVWERPEPLTTMAPPLPVATAVLGPGYLTVVVSMVIDQNGLVTESEVLRSVDAHLDKGALDAVEAWRYQTATLNGFPVKVYGIIELNFKLDGS